MDEMKNINDPLHLNSYQQLINTVLNHLYLQIQNQYNPCNFLSHIPEQALQALHPAWEYHPRQVQPPMTTHE